MFEYCMIREIYCVVLRRELHKRMLENTGRMLIPDGPSSMPLWAQKCSLEERCLAAAVLLLQISQLQHT